MPKATIEFNLPEEKAEHELCNNAGKMYSIIYDLYTYLRTDTKHGKANHTEVYDYLFEIMNEYKFDLFE